VALHYRRRVTQTIDGYVAIAMLPIAVIALGLAFVLSRRSRLSFAQVVLAALSLGAILAVTLFGRMLKLEHWGSGDLTVSWLTDGPSWSRVADIDRPWLLNFALYVPAAFLLVLAWGRAAAVVGCLAALSLVIEFIQRWTMLGAGDPADLVANILGATLGAIGAHVVRSRTGAGRVQGEAPVGPRATIEG
jgi:tetrahydromethanopterin S-methyltransferase subunit E